ncbi:hypothetical protein J6590_030894 [Homalodisca vitripennis]|nr:hypothetical protein J6590_030894 [Homalodisca vitripennis]
MTKPSAITTTESDDDLRNINTVIVDRSCIASSWLNLLSIWEKTEEIAQLTPVASAFLFPTRPTRCRNSANLRSTTSTVKGYCSVIMYKSWSKKDVVEKTKANIAYLCRWSFSSVDLTRALRKRRDNIIPMLGGRTLLLFWFQMINRERAETC